MKLSHFIFCDDIRHEKNNKLSLMGLYNDSIIIQSRDKNKIKWPIQMILALALRFQIDVGDERPDNFKLEYFINKKSVIKIQGQVNIATASLSAFNLTLKAPIPIELGMLEFTIKLLKKDKILFTETQSNAIEILHKTIQN
jgi:hypothetical protein